jgi:hypothetical protein
MRRTDRQGAGTHAAHHDEEKELIGCRDHGKQEACAPCRVRMDQIVAQASKTRREPSRTVSRPKIVFL